MQRAATVGASPIQSARPATSRPAAPWLQRTWQPTPLIGTTADLWGRAQWEFDITPGAACSNWRVSVIPDSAKITICYNRSSGLSGTRTYTTTPTGLSFNSSVVGGLSSLTADFRWRSVQLRSSSGSGTYTTIGPVPAYPCSAEIGLRFTDPNNPDCTCDVTVTDPVLPAPSGSVTAHSSVALGWVTFAFS